MPAYAHTTLAGSEPAHREVLAVAPGEVSLEFSLAVDPRLVSAVLLSADGETEVQPPRLTPDRPDTTTVSFAVPSLGHGTYGLQWLSVGSDGHQVSGEVIFTVGAAGDAPASVGAGSPSITMAALRTTAHGARVAWQVGLVLLGGALFAAAWLRRRRPSDGRALETSVDAAGRWGGRLAVVGLGTGWVTGVALMSASLTGVNASSVRAALGSPVSVVGAVGVALMLLLLVDRMSAERLVTGRTAQAAAAVLLTIIGLRVSVSHAARGDLLVESGRIALGVGHAAAAALWLGPIVVLAIGLAGRRKTTRETVPDHLVRAYLGDYARLAGWVFGLLLITGFTQWTTITGARVSLDGYTAIVLIKALLVGLVVVPLAWHHHRSVRGARRFGATLRVEVLAGIAVLVLGGVLVGVAPPSGQGGAGVPPGTALPLEQPEDVADCAALTVGRTDCYRSHFAGVLHADGSGAALAAIEATRAQDQQVAEQCHQLTHDLGHEAAAALGLAEALAVDGSLCASGYYHGVVEASLEDDPDEDLDRVVPTLCDSVADPRYSSIHYSCVHGVGHGLMLRSGLDLFASLPGCGAYEDGWERHSCWSGVFMENVVAVQEGHATGEFREDDLLYPCSVVEEDQKPACFSIHTGYLLWQNGFDVQAAFAVCDEAESAHIPACYQSMGRDISGFSLLNPDAVVSACALGSAQWRGHCYAGAALDAVYTENGTETATVLCQAVPAEHRPLCLQARDGLAERL